MVQSFLWFPLLLANASKCMLPRNVFIRFYCPSSPIQQEAEQAVRNKLRLIKYQTLKRLSKVW